ncbi:hypothetical protein BZA77DRAFT_343110 [Pyronema omphalodes]|nr:hypothetical protein BZA77DRAFT_347046 [Pyronema omphalodes]KAI5817956.1 hypothetical protein BZA77DRAFT_343110 [Pyronema omphalodes]
MQYLQPGCTAFTFTPASSTTPSSSAIRVHQTTQNYQTFDMAKRRKNRAASTSAESGTITRQTESAETKTPPETITTNTELATSNAKKMLCTPVDNQLTFPIDGDNLPSTLPKRKKRKTKRKKHQPARTALPSSAPASPWSKCPTEVLYSIIGFLKADKTARCHPDLLNLRLVNREFRYLLQPVLFESVRIPRRSCRRPAVTNDVRQLLRLIDLNPSIATCIKELTLYEAYPNRREDAQCSLQEQEHDYRIYSKFAEEMELEMSAEKSFGYPLHPSGQRETLQVYDQMCTPLVLSQLTNLRTLIFSGYVGGGYAILLTPWAKAIWERMPLRSLEVLRWQHGRSWYMYELMSWPANNPHNDSTAPGKREPPNNDWNIISFLRFTPSLKQLSLINNQFFEKATPHNLPVLPFLTALHMEAHCQDPNETSQCLLELAKCTPVLKTVKLCHPERYHPGPYDALPLKQALNLVRNSIEEINIDAVIKLNSSGTGGIGPFHDFRSSGKYQLM